MERFISAAKQSLENENWYAALYLCLTLPDICARLESEDSKTNRSRYVAWYDRYMADKYRHQFDDKLHVYLSGNDFYALRCAMLHEGGSDITSQQCKEALERFHFSIGCSHGTHDERTKVLQLDVPYFCNDVCDSVESWFNDFMDNHGDKAYRIGELVKIHVGPHSMGGGVFIG